MRNIEKYISTTENSIKPNATKTVLSDEAFAICEFLELLKEQIARSKL